MIMAVLFLLAASSIMLSGVAAPLVTDVRTVGDFAASRQSFALAEGGVEDVAYRIKEGLSVSDIENFTEGSVTAEVTNTTVLGEREVAAVGEERNAVRRTKVVLVEGEGGSFNYGLQAGEGGINLKNTSSIHGNVFSNGPVTGENSNIVSGDIISAGSTGRIDGVHATGTAYAHTIDDSDIDGDAYYMVIDDTDVDGTEHPNSPDIGTSTLSITDAQIEEWKDAAFAGGTYEGECPYKITSSATIGPIKVPCDLQIEGTASVTLAGNVWIEGDLQVQNSATVNVSGALSGKTVAVVADKPSDPASKGRITLSNTTTFNGSGEGSYILFVSQNTSAEGGGGTAAIEVQNSAQGDVLVYAPHGKIVLKNSVKLKEVSGYLIEAENSAEVTYETGLANLLFTSGPSGGWNLTDWEEI